MSAPSTRGPQKIPVSQITRGLNAGLSCSSKQLPLKAGACGMKAKGKGAAALRPYKEKMARFPVRTGTQRTRNSPLRAVTSAWVITRSRLRRGG
jgi:hypothetical protein